MNIGTYLFWIKSSFLRPVAFSVFSVYPVCSGGIGRFFADALAFYTT